jgi:predicted Zn finger-like uncharacterized protein
MILSCNSCGKKFVVPDSAISTSGRTVQCGSCGNKWKQFPINEIKKSQSVPKNNNTLSRQKKIKQKTQKSKKRPLRKTREINLYSPEYLAKKHGIKLNNEGVNESSSEKKISFGFYSYLLLYLVIIITLSRGLYFFQDFVVQKLPFTEFYINYFFESLRNMFEIWKNLITRY